MHALFSSWNDTKNHLILYNLCIKCEVHINNLKVAFNSTTYRECC